MNYDPQIGSNTPGINSAPVSDGRVQMKFAVKPWWKRFTVSIEMLVFGTVVIDGYITEMGQDGVKW